MKDDILEELQFYREELMGDMASGNFVTLDDMLVRAIDEIKKLRAAVKDKV